MSTIYTCTLFDSNEEKSIDYSLPISFATNRPVLYSKLTIFGQIVINKPWVSSWKETETTNGQVKKNQARKHATFQHIEAFEQTTNNRLW